MRKHSKRYIKSSQLRESDKIYALEEAVKILKDSQKVKFDETVEITVDLNVDSTKSDQMIRGSVILPHGTGKQVKVAVFCKGEAEKAARDAGADFVGAEDLMNKVNGGWLEFDSAIATPDMMRDLSKLGKILGPRGLMPSPKAGTVTQDVAKAIKEVKAGRIDFKMDKQGDVHMIAGKLSFSPEQICNNIKTALNVLESLKPSSVKGDFFKNVSISSTMGVGLKIQP